jgi:hypothetical protein
VGRLGSPLERRQGVVLTGFPVIVVVPVGRLQAVTILLIEDVGVTVGVPIVVGVDIGADTSRSESSELKGDAGVRIEL